MNATRPVADSSLVHPNDPRPDGRRLLRRARMVGGTADVLRVYAGRRNVLPDALVGLGVPSQEEDVRGQQPRRLAITPELVDAITRHDAGTIAVCSQNFANNSGIASAITSDTLGMITV